MPQVEQPKTSSKWLSRKFLFALFSLAGCALMFYGAIRRGDYDAAAEAMKLAAGVFGIYAVAEGTADTAERWQLGKAQVLRTDLTTRQTMSDALDSPGPIVPGNRLDDPDDEPLGPIAPGNQ